MVDAELQEIDEQWKTGDRAVARAMAAVYIGAHPEIGARLGNLELHELVALVEAARASGDDDERVTVDAYLLAVHQPQVITGNMGG